MDLGLKGKFALVTGGSRGIGQAIALALAAEGANVAICARGKDGEVERTIDQLRSLFRDGQFIGVRGDVAQEEDRTHIWHVVHSSWGRLDILVNNAGGGGRVGGEVVEEAYQDVWEVVYERNAGAAIWFTMRAIPVMLRQWVSPAPMGYGRVVTVASVHGLDHRGRPWFSMAKSAEIALMRSLAGDKRLARAGLTFNSVAPGPVMVGGWLNILKPELEDEKKGLVLGRLGTPEEVASAVVFLCSTRASLINGACLVMDGGGTL